MKNRLTRKLFLSIAALGVTAATLTTSTFAWYTANTEAKVTEIKAGTESKGSDSLFIAAAKTYNDTTSAAATWDDYYAEATPVTTASVSASTKSFNLRPVYSNYGTCNIINADSDNSVTAVAGRSYNKIAGSTANYSYAKTSDAAIAAGKTYYTQSGESAPYTYTPVASPVVEDITTYYEQTRENDTVSYATEDKKDFIEFVIRVRSGNVLAAKTPLYFSSFDLTSTQSDAKQIALASGTGTGITNAGPYGADVLKALKLDVTSADVSLATDGTIPATPATTRAAGASAEENKVSTYAFTSLAKADTNIDEGGANAVGYYNTVMNKKIAVPTGENADYNVGTELAKVAKDTLTKDTALAVASLPATETGKQFSVVEIRFVLYLDGWDSYCYDVMQSQNVNFSFTLTTDPKLAVVKAA